MRAFFRGDGWGFGEGRGPGIFLEGEEGEVRILRADGPERLPNVLASLDEIASSGDPNLLAAGFISYEAGVWIEGSTALVRHHDFLPFAEFFVFDLNTRSASPCATSEESTRCARAGSSKVNEGGKKIPGLSSDLAGRKGERSLSPTEWKEGVGTIRDAIARGDVYQVNLTRRTRFAARVEPFALADALYADNPVPFAVALVGAGWAVVSNSPELFLDVDLAARRAVTKPIKGTIARGATEAEDAGRRRELLASAKDAA